MEGAILLMWDHEPSREEWEPMPPPCPGGCGMLIDECACPDLLDGVTFTPYLSQWASDPRCTCYATDPETWEYYNGTPAPWTQMEQNPDCPVHPGTTAEEEAVNTYAGWVETRERRDLPRVQCYRDRPHAGHTHINEGRQKDGRVGGCGMPEWCPGIKGEHRG